MEIFIFYLFWINWTFSLKNKKKSEGLRPGSKTQTNIFFKDCLKVLQLRISGQKNVMLCVVIGWVYDNFQHNNIFISLF